MPCSLVVHLGGTYSGLVKQVADGKQKCWRNSTGLYDVKSKKMLLFEVTVVKNFSSTKAFLSCKQIKPQISNKNVGRHLWFIY
jgi:hypothetical protein